MHNLKIGVWSINYNGDFSGSVFFRKDGVGNWAGIPFTVIEQLVAEKVRAERIAHLEMADTKELLSWGAYMAYLMLSKLHLGRNSEAGSKNS